ncbi:hypothetical protein TOPH_03293 [Tolypocladium ophioglossoides CBS 100239]|uniref:Uncharacterized protein n=1 Tax=Tolypocladium ophioglossoides (strain CBS 100239) TaxID=1163406 RepID=A0A0L0NDE9_TOLOC|nr:hypothetical protein TOPH_03293 [Tolypocladium ophioglossoides CBS 100239]
MSLRTITGRIAVGSALVVTATAGIYTALVYRRISVADMRRITSQDYVADSLRGSATIRQLVNPRGHAALEDSRSITLTIPRGQRVSDEAILAQFVKAFFGGRVFAPERVGLGLFRQSVGPFNGLEPAAPPQQVWDASQLSDQTLPPLHTTLFSGFQVLAIQLAPRSEKGSASESSVDIAFGSSERQFGSCHRFSVVQEAPRGADGDTTARLCFACVACNPAGDQPLRLGSMLWVFHRAYAMLLFRDAVAGVKAFTNGVF